jgi:hypothetical protein
VVLVLDQQAVAVALVALVEHQIQDPLVNYQNLSLF